MKDSDDIISKKSNPKHEKSFRWCCECFLVSNYLLLKFSLMFSYYRRNSCIRGRRNKRFSPHKFINYFLEVPNEPTKLCWVSPQKRRNPLIFLHERKIVPNPPDLLDYDDIQEFWCPKKIFSICITWLYVAVVPIMRKWASWWNGFNIMCRKKKTPKISFHFNE